MARGANGDGEVDNGWERPRLGAGRPAALVVAPLTRACYLREKTMQEVDDDAGKKLDLNGWKAMHRMVGA